MFLDDEILEAFEEATRPDWGDDMYWAWSSWRRERRRRHQCEKEIRRELEAQPARKNKRNKRRRENHATKPETNRMQSASWYAKNYGNGDPIAGRREYKRQWRLRNLGKERKRQREQKRRAWPKDKLKRKARIAARRENR